MTPSFSSETTSWPARLANRLRSSSAAGSSAMTSSTSPTSIESMLSRVWNSGSGQYSPMQSSVRAGLGSSTMWSPFAGAEA